MPSRARASTSGSSSPVHEVVVVLHADDRRDGLGLGELCVVTLLTPRCRISPSCCSCGERLERLGQRPLDRLGEAGHPQVDHVEDVEAQVVEVVVHGLAQLVGRQCLGPVAVRRPPGADLGDDHQVVGVGVQGLADDLVGDVRAVVVAGVDVVDAELDRPAEHRDRRRPGRPGGPITCGPASCMAPYPSRCTERSPRANLPDFSAVVVMSPLLPVSGRASAAGSGGLVATRSGRRHVHVRPLQRLRGGRARAPMRRARTAMPAPASASTAPTHMGAV